MANGTTNGPYAGSFSGGGLESQEVQFKLALTSAAARLRETTPDVAEPYSLQLLHTAKLLEAMAGEGEA